MLINIYYVDWISPLIASLKHAWASGVNSLQDFLRLFYCFCFHRNKQELMKLHSEIFAPSRLLAACPWWSFPKLSIPPFLKQFLLSYKLFSKLQCDVFSILTLSITILPQKKVSDSSVSTRKVLFISIWLTKDQSICWGHQHNAEQKP